jgi:uncharacterized membrane protein YkvA (DUF1232 family)
MKPFLQPLYSVYKAVLKNPKYRWLAIAGSLVYLLSPVDLVTDFLPIVGWIDDGLVATLLITELSQLLLEKRQGKSDETAETDPTITV